MQWFIGYVCLSSQQWSTSYCYEFVESIHMFTYSSYATVNPSGSQLDIPGLPETWGATASLLIVEAILECLFKLLLDTCTLHYLGFVVLPRAASIYKWPQSKHHRVIHQGHIEISFLREKFGKWSYFNPLLCLQIWLSLTFPLFLVSD